MNILSIFNRLVGKVIVNSYENGKKREDSGQQIYFLINRAIISVTPTRNKKGVLTDSNCFCTVVVVNIDPGVVYKPKLFVK